MLLSPGHSPRRLSSPSPSPAPSVSQTPIAGSSSSITNSNPRKRNSSSSSSTVLDEDTYVAAIEKIIERDFFPDIPKLRDRLDWLEATRSGDPMLIRDAQLKIIERRAGKTPVSNTEGKIRTPGSTFFRNDTPLDIDRTPGFDKNVNSEFVSVVKDLGRDDSGNVGGSDLDELTLDAFFRRYTSEDNDSFSKLIEKVNKRKKERYDFLLEGEKRETGGLIEDVKKDRITDGYGTSGQPLASLDGWKYTAKNLLMYHPADRGEVALTQEELANRMKGMTKEISKTNTRFHGKMMDSRPKEDDVISVLYNTVASGTPVPWSDRDGDKMKRYDLEDLKKTPNQFYVESNKKADNGYSFVKTPSPAPGVDESPFITWGEIEGTPLRLEPEDTPIDIGGSGNGPQFNIPLPPTRDLKAHSLSREAARKIRDRSKMFQKPPLPSVARGGSASPGARTLSPAAQKFVRNAIAKSSHSATVDESLRASYRGSSPGMGTPKAARSTSRLGRDGSMTSRSPSVRDGSNPPW
uniref:splicing factor ESS-2 homolog n=1 Tax=Erigeron canadensis TaxID=72917 RepID=UPI001CB96681|nr:splicing factor ESS-2 homolog [Erigeron canadensis]